METITLTTYELEALESILYARHVKSQTPSKVIMQLLSKVNPAKYRITDVGLKVISLCE